MSFKDEIYGVGTPFMEVVQEHFDIVWVADFEKEPKKYPNIVGILVWTMPTVRKEWLDNMPNLKVVSSVGVGYNHLDVPLIRSYGVKISNTPNVLNGAVADLGMTLILAAARNIVNMMTFNRTGLTSNPLNMVATEVTGSTLGIVGMGRIGYMVAKRARAFDMKILYHNRSQRPADEEAAVGVTYYSSLNEMLPLCDFVIVILCLTDETRHIMGEEQFKLMKKSAIFVNISRGGTVDQDALVKALKTGEIHSAALDVTTPEPLPKEHELFTMKNVILTPHVGSQTGSTRLKMIKLAVDNIVAGVNGTKLPTEVMD